jgi:sec-independent protein translocase protein TatC
MFSRLITDAGGSLNMTMPQEGFTLSLKLSILAAIFLAAPFILAQVWLFISPGLYRHERRYALPFVFFSSILFVAGGMFGYFVALPFAIPYLLNIGKENLGLTTFLSATYTFDLIFAIELGLGVVFLIPALIFILARIGLVSGGFLLKNTKYAVLGSFVVAAIITPTGDIPNMMILAGPMIALYMLGVIVAFLFGKKRTREA